MRTYTLLQGNCKKHLPDLAGKVDLIVTSPPYDNLRQYKEYEFDFDSIAPLLVQSLKPGGVMVWIVGDACIDGSETGTSFRQALSFIDLGFKLHDTMIYMKTGVVYPNVARYHQAFEYMFVFSNGSPLTFNPLMDRINKTFGRPTHGTERRPDGTTKPRVRAEAITPQLGRRYNVWKIPNALRINTWHPAIFPLALAMDHIKSWSNEGNLVLDPFVGSGTTIEAAMRLNRRVVGIEISEEYCVQIRRRMSWLGTEQQL